MKKVEEITMMEELKTDMERQLRLLYDELHVCNKNDTEDIIGRIKAYEEIYKTICEAETAKKDSEKAKQSELVNTIINACGGVVSGVLSLATIKTVIEYETTGGGSFFTTIGRSMISGISKLKK